MTREGNEKFGTGGPKFAMLRPLLSGRILLNEPTNQQTNKAINKYNYKYRHINKQVTAR